MRSKKEDINKIIEGCKINDRRSQELLYKEFYMSMASLCKRYISNEQDAMQILNDGFLKIFKNIQLYNNAKAGIYTWMSRIMINTAIDFLRKRPIAYVSDFSSTEEESAVENNIVQKINADALLSLIRQLPIATQLVFNLYTIDGFNHREISKMLKISEGTSRWHISDARRQLKKLILSYQIKL
ncbi:MAG: RNA polymerase sigma factor [Ginsengibacter sp.]